MQGFSKCLGLFQVIGGKPQLPIIHYMSSGKYFVHQAIGGVFLPRSPVPYGFWRPDLVLHSHIVFEWRISFWLAGWWVAGCWLGGWLAGGLAGRRAGWLAGWLGLAGLLVYIIWMAGIWCRMWAPGLTGMNLTSFWPRFGPRTGPRTICICLLIGYINDEDKVPISH